MALIKILDPACPKSKLTPDRHLGALPDCFQIYRQNFDLEETHAPRSRFLSVKPNSELSLRDCFKIDLYKNILKTFYVFYRDFTLNTFKNANDAIFVNSEILFNPFFLRTLFFLFGTHETTLICTSNVDD